MNNLRHSPGAVYLLSVLATAGACSSSPPSPLDPDAAAGSPTSMPDRAADASSRPASAGRASAQPATGSNGMAPTGPRDEPAAGGPAEPADEGPVEVTLNRLPDFESPPVSVRLKARFAAVDTSASLQELAKTGFGAVEMGASLEDPGSLAATLSDARAAGISVDLAPGGSMPYAAPGIGEADSMQQLSRAVSETLRSDGTLMYSARAPQPTSAQLAESPTLKLVAVTAARVVDAASSPILLEAESATDLSASVGASGLVEWQVPTGDWLVFGFWQRATGQTPNGYPPFEDPAAWSSRVPSEGFGQNFMADIFSGVGIAKALSGLSSLPAETLEALRGTQFAHDSHEVQAEMFWTSALPAEFATRRGYSMLEYLPALHAPKEASFDPLTQGWGTKPPLMPEYDFTNEVGARARYDYHLTLNDLYVGEYLKTFTQTLNQYGMSSRAQVAYNYLPLNMTRSGAAVDIPENESLDSGWTTANDPTLPMYGTERWRHALDSYRLTGSGVHLNTGKRATVEFGDDFAIYRKQPVDYAQQLNEACAGGITMGLLTGFAGIGSGWPASSALDAIGIGDFWTTAWPQWRDWTQLAAYFARSTLVLETGLPRMDVVIYLDEGIAGVHELTTPKFASDKLETSGFTYDFIDPVTLASARATEVSGTLFGNGPAYRALVLDDEPRLPLEVAETILTAAKSGLTVIIVGSAPSATTGLLDAATRDAAVAASMAELIALDNVAVVATRDEVPAALLQRGVLPAASFGESSPLLSVHRRTEQGEDIWWILNPSLTDSAVSASFATQGTPYLLDLWNGTTERVAHWSRNDGRVSLPLAVPARGTTAIMFQHQGAPLHVTATTAQAASYDGDTLVLRDTRGGTQEVTLSDGTTHSVELAAVPVAIQVGDWHLVVEEISPTGDATHTLDLPQLQDWRDIPELRDAVGSGTYTANPELPETLLNPNTDVLIDVGGVAGAMQLSVNGTLVTKQTTPGGKWSVGKLLKSGQNEIAVRLDTTLLNRMAAQSSTGGAPSLTPLPSGLLGPVQLIPVALGRIP